MAAFGNTGLPVAPGRVRQLFVVTHTGRPQSVSQHTQRDAHWHAGGVAEGAGECFWKAFQMDGWMDEWRKKKFRWQIYVYFFLCVYS